MPITPTAPDYVSQVRGIIGDLREDYIKKQQLFLQERDQDNKLALSYAQLDLQKDQLNMQMGNAARELELGRLKIAAAAQATTSQAAIEQSRYAAEYAKANAASYDKMQKADLEERKFNFDLWKEDKKLQDEQRIREADTNSGRLQQEGFIALNSDDPTKLIEWTNKLAGSILSQKQRNDVFTNALSLVEAKKKLEQDSINIRTQPKALEIVQGLNMLDVSRLTPDQLAGSLQQATDSFKSLGNTDSKLNDVFMSVSQEVAKRQTDFRQKEYGKSLDSFLKTAAIGELDPQAQKEWNQLQQDFPDDQARVSSSDYSDSVRRLMFQTNKRKSIEQLRAMDKQNLSIVENLVTQNPGLAATKTDPQTKQSYKVFPYPTPDLTPSIGNDGAIDPDTGLLTKSIIDSNKKWTAEVTSPSFLLGQVPFIRSMNLSAPQAPVPADKKAIETVSALPFRSESPSKFDMVQEPGTARVATAPVADKTKISDSTITTIVEAYRNNPDAIIYGRPAREIIANLKAKGYAIPDVLAAPIGTR